MADKQERKKRHQRTRRIKTQFWLPAHLIRTRTVRPPAVENIPPPLQSNVPCVRLNNIGIHSIECFHYRLIFVNKIFDLESSSKNENGSNDLRQTARCFHRFEDSHFSFMGKSTYQIIQFIQNTLAIGTIRFNHRLANYKMKSSDC